MATALTVQACCQGAGIEAGQLGLELVFQYGMLDPTAWALGKQKHLKSSYVCFFVCVDNSASSPVNQYLRIRVATSD